MHEHHKKLHHANIKNINSLDLLTLKPVKRKHEYLEKHCCGVFRHTHYRNVSERFWCTHTVEKVRQKSTKQEYKGRLLLKTKQADHSGETRALSNGNSPQKPISPTTAARQRIYHRLELKGDCRKSKKTAKKISGTILSFLVQWRLHSSRLKIKLWTELE